MLDWSDSFGGLLLWLAFMAVCCAWAVRIASLLRRQHRTEVAYRLRLAMARGASMRELESRAGERR